MGRGMAKSTDPPSGGYKGTGSKVWWRFEPSEDIKPLTESVSDSEMREDAQSNEYDSKKAEYHHLQVIIK